MQDGDGDDSDGTGAVLNKRFGDLVREKREEKEWSQRRLAELLEEAGVRLDPSAITRIERGTRDVKLREADAIASVLGFDLGRSLRQIALSTDQQFRMGVAALELSANRARKRLVEVLDQVDQITVKLDPETEERLMKEGGFSERVDLYASFVRRTHWQQAHTTDYYDEADRELKQAIVDAVVNQILVKAPDEIF
jgi:transcriptional regulator with XRE-family HTH domain